VLDVWKEEGYLEDDAIPVFFIGNTVRLYKRGRKVFHVKTRSSPPACLLDPKYGEHKYLTVNGVRLHYVESGDHSKPLIVFVHGWPQFWFAWRHQIEHFNKEYHVVALDMRGFNDSEKPEGIQSYFVLNMVEDIRQLVEGLGKNKFTLVAHDWGGVVGWLFAAFHPQMLENYIACNMPHPVAFNNARKSLDQALKSWYIVFFQVPLLPEINMMMDDIKSFDALFKDNHNKDDEVMEAYRYAFRDFKTWNRTINYYRCTTYNATRDLLEGGIIAKLLDEKWSTYAQGMFMKRLGILILHLLTLSMAVYQRPMSDQSLLRGLKPGSESITAEDISRYCFEVATLLGCAAFIVDAWCPLIVVE